MKKCMHCGLGIDIFGTEGYVNVYPEDKLGKMESYHLKCYSEKILKEASA
jgi:hypothetical protein